MSPLERLLLELRSAGVAVDIAKVLLLLRALQGSFGSSPEALRRLIHAMFCSTEVERSLLDQLYDGFLSDVEETRSNRLASSVAAPANKATQHYDRGLESDIEEALTLLQMTEPGQPSVEGAPIVRQLVSASAIQEEAQLLSATDTPISAQDYMPISRRQMRQNWRYLRVPTREGPPVELDIRATLAKISREGFFPEPVMLPRRVSRAELVLLVDVHGSMSPFHELARRLTQTAIDGGRFRRVRSFFFHNIPDEQLMTSPAFTDAVPLPLFLHNLPARSTFLTVVSDAGAARGNLSDRRVDQTRDFLRILSRTPVRIAWLNPVPRERWHATSAERIGQFAPMYEISRHGVDRAIAMLRRPLGRHDPRLM